MAATLAIAIPLIDRDLCDDWDVVLKYLDGALRSVFAQSSGDYLLAVSCNQRPAGGIFDDPRIKYLVLPPVDRAKLQKNPRADVQGKHAANRRWAVKTEARYFYELDADDLISAKLVEYIASAPPAAGFIIRSGYALNNPSGQLAVIPNPKRPQSHFDTCCGSSLIISMDPAATPEQRGKRIFEIVKGGHHVARARFAEVFGKNAVDIPFPAGVYRLNNGENISVRLGNNFAWSWLNPMSAEEASAIRPAFGLS